MTLPEDIVKYVKKKVIRCISLFVICLCATIAISILTWNYFSARTPLAFHIGVVFWINIIPFFFLLIPSIIIALKHQENFVKIKDISNGRAQEQFYSRYH